MKNLMIKDLSLTEELDHKTMMTVQGGMIKGSPVPLFLFGDSKHDFAINASQLIGQTQNIVNENGNNAAFVSGISSTITPSQDAHNNIRF